MKIAIVHDYLREYGGAERVVEAMHEIWPEAPLYTAFVDWQSLGRHADRFRNWDIRTSWVQGNPIVKALHSPLRFLAPKIWESFDLSGFDIVISSSGWYICRGVITKSNIKYQKSNIQIKDQIYTENHALHICYIHHPPRNLYGYATGSDIQKYWPVRAYAQIVNFFLRHYDFETAQQVDYFVANSKETARRVWKFYRRESTVIYPPVGGNDKFQMTNDKLNPKSKISNSKQYFLSVGRLSWAKRVDLAIVACNQLNLPLKIVGTGKEREYLRTLSGPTIEFVGNVSDDELAKLYQGARALLFTALDEDFGIVPVEAMGYGTPVIALAQGGVLETVVDGKTGILFHEASKEALIGAIQRFNATKREWTRDSQMRAVKFSKAQFKKKFRQFVESAFVSARNT